MTARSLACFLGVSLLLPLCSSAAADSVLSEPPSSRTTAQALEREIDRLEREFRRLRRSGAGGASVNVAPAEDALEELRHMRSELDFWLAGTEGEAYRRNLDRFLRHFGLRLGRLAAELREPVRRRLPAMGAQPKSPPERRARVDLRAPATAAPANDDCASATPIGDGSHGGDTTAATVDGEASCGATLVGPDVWFRYVAPASGEVMFNTQGSAFDTVLSLHSGCPGTSANELACNDDDVGVQSGLTHSMATGDEVLVRIGGFAGDFGAFLLSAGRPVEIAGTVTDAATGFGIDEVDIAIVDGSGYSQAWATSSASGAYSATGLRQGVYYVEAYHPAYQAEVYDDVACADSCDPTTGTPIPVGLGEVARADFALDRSGAIEGVITDAMSGDPVAGIRVWIADPDGGWQGSDVSAADGGYSVVGLAPGSYFATAEPGFGYMGELFDDHPCPDYCDPTEGTAIPVAAGVPAQADFSLEIGGSIAGQITDAVTGLPSEYGRVTVFDQDGNWLGSEYADAAGHYVYPGLATGTYFALGSDWDYLDQLYDGLECYPGCDVTSGTPISVSQGGETVGIDFALLRGAAFSGIVVHEATGAPAQDVVVQAWDEQGGWAGNSGYTDFGVYAVGGLSAGTYFATTSNLAYLDELYDDLPCVGGECDPTTGSPIAVAASTTTTGVDFALELGAWLSGRVFEVAQQRDLHGWVRLWDSGGNQVDDGFFGDGAYSMSGLTTGTYFVSTFGVYGYNDELYDDLPCPAGCDPTSGTPLALTAGTVTSNVDFGLCGGPIVQPHFPPSQDPSSFIDGCRVQVGGAASAYDPSCPAVARIHWEWGDGKQGDAGFPAIHMYEPGAEWVTASVTAFDALDLGSEAVSKELRLWDCLEPGACGYPENRQLFNLTFASTELIQACSTIVLGPGLSVLEPGDVTILAGGSVKLADGVRFVGGRVTIGTDPGLLP